MKLYALRKSSMSLSTWLNSDVIEVVGNVSWGSTVTVTQMQDLYRMLMSSRLGNCGRYSGFVTIADVIGA